MKTINKILLILGIFLFLFITTMCIFFALYQQVPDTLIVAVLGSGGLECIITGFITITKVKHEEVEEQNPDELEEELLDEE